MQSKTSREKIREKKDLWRGFFDQQGRMKWEDGGLVAVSDPYERDVLQRAKLIKINGGAVIAPGWAHLAHHALRLWVAVRNQIKRNYLGDRASKEKTPRLYSTKDTPRFVKILEQIRDDDGLSSSLIVAIQSKADGETLLKVLVISGVLSEYRVAMMTQEEIEAIHREAENEATA